MKAVNVWLPRVASRARSSKQRHLWPVAFHRAAGWRDALRLCDNCDETKFNSAILVYFFAVLCNTWGH